MEAQRTVRPGGGGEQLEQRDRYVVCCVSALWVEVTHSWLVLVKIHQLAVAARPPCARHSPRRTRNAPRDWGTELAQNPPKLPKNTVSLNGGKSAV